MAKAVEPTDLICKAIGSRSLLAFDYDGRRRIVAPYCHGFGARGVEFLRAIQVGGGSRSGGFGFGKLWTVSRMGAVRVSGDSFVPDDPSYNPNDSAMVRIHCRV
jgi:hypothetical protein